MEIHSSPSCVCGGCVWYGCVVCVGGEVSLSGFMDKVQQL